ncbi:MAG: NYN domain-containing protein [bacterium]|nr:NYN domain-containing protein [bacterium]
MKKNIYAYLDNENINISIQKLGRKIDRIKLRKRLTKRYGVTRAYMFMGYLPAQQEMYTFFQNIGYTLVFKPVNEKSTSQTKGNVDAELVLQAMIDVQEYTTAVIITGDGDFGSLVRYLREKHKLETLIAPNARRYASLLRDAAGKQITSLSKHKKQLQYIPGPSKDE